VWVDRKGWISPGNAAWSIDWRIRTGDGWESARNNRKSEQRLIGGSTIETTVPTAVGPIVQRVAVGVVGGQPAAIIEIVNTASVAIAVALSVRPFARQTLGPLNALRAGVDGIEIDGVHVLAADRPAASVVGDADHDVFELLEGAADASGAVSIDSASGRANAALVWPLAHTSTLRAVVPLKTAVPAAAAVPGIDDIVRGWDRHLDSAARAVVQDSAVTEAFPALARDLACRAPADGDVAAWMIGLTELGLGREAVAGVRWLTKEEDPAWTIFAIGRLAHLGFGGAWFEDALEPLARAAHTLRKPAASKSTPPGWRPSIVAAAAHACRHIEQPDVAENLDTIAAAHSATMDLVDPDLVSKLHDATPTWAWPAADGSTPHDLRSSAVMAAHLRNTLVIDDPVADGGQSADLHILPVLPLEWRGLGVEAHQIPTSWGEASFGLRWHGPRPALLWEIHTVDDRPVTIRVPSVSSTWQTTEPVGESLLPDPGWVKG